MLWLGIHNTDIQDKSAPACLAQWFQLPAPSQCWEIENYVYASSYISLDQEALNIWTILAQLRPWTLRARYRLKSAASPLFTQPFIQTQIKENIKAPRHWPLGGIHRGPVNSPHKWPATRKMFPFDDVIMNSAFHTCGRTRMDVWANISSGPLYPQFCNVLKTLVTLISYQVHIWAAETSRILVHQQAKRWQKFLL